MKGYLYILQSTKNNSYYIGSSSNPIKRLNNHNSGKVQSTKYKKPYKLIFTQEFNSIKTAQKAERIIKNWKRKDYIEKIILEKRFKKFDK